MVRDFSGAGGESPAASGILIRFSVGGRNGVPERFFEYTPWFASVERVALMGLGMFHLLEPLWTPSLPQAAL